MAFQQLTQSEIQNLSPLEQQNYLLRESFVQQLPDLVSYEFQRMGIPSSMFETYYPLIEEQALKEVPYLQVPYMEVATPDFMQQTIKNQLQSTAIQAINNVYNSLPQGDPFRSAKAGWDVQKSAEFKADTQYIDMIPYLLAAATAAGAMGMFSPTGAAAGTGTTAAATQAAAPIVESIPTWISPAYAAELSAAGMLTPELAAIADASASGTAASGMLPFEIGTNPATWAQATGSGLPINPLTGAADLSGGGAALSNLGMGAGTTAASSFPYLSSAAVPMTTIGGGLLGGAPAAPEWLQSISKATGIPTGMLSTLGSTALSGLGSYLQQKSATEAAQTSANAQIEAARIAAEAAKFRPVGVTTRFGQSQFGYDPVTGNLTSAGYTVSPEIKAQQDALMGVSNQALQQYQGAMGAAAPMGAAASGLFGLGQSYLGTTPQQQAAKYMAEQQALLAPYRDREFANLENRLLQQGRLGLATGGTSTLGAANPELEAYYNAKRMQDLQLAAQATQGGMDYTKFGAGLMGTGGDLLKQMYGTQTAAYAPYQTALGGATALEALGQQPMDIGTSIGAKTSTAGAQAGMLTAQGMQGAAQTMQPYNAYSPWGALLTGAGNTIQNYQTQQQQQQLNNQLLSALWSK